MENKILLKNIAQMHTTKMGYERIKKNLKLVIDDVLEYCKNIIMDKNTQIYKNGKMRNK